MSKGNYFPDNTVLINFATVDRLAVLRRVLNGRGRWTEAVHYEVSRSAEHVPNLRSVISEGWLGAPISITDPRLAEQVERVRRASFGGTPEKPLQHLGEAQTCCLLSSESAYHGSTWVSDDREAVEFAQQQGIRTLRTMDIVHLAVADGDLTAEDGFDLLQQIADQGRSIALPGSAGELSR